MTDWKAAVRTWEIRETKDKGKAITTQDYTQRDYTGKEERLMNMIWDTEDST